MELIAKILKDSIFFWEEEYDNLDPLSTDDLHLLKNQGNTAINWSDVRFFAKSIKERNQTISSIRNCSFSGRIVIGNLEGTVRGPHGVQLPCGLQNCNFFGDCIISDGCCIKDIFLLKDVFVGMETVIVACGSILCNDLCDNFPYINIEVGPETGGRSVSVHAGISYGEICSCALDRKNKTNAALSSSSNDRTQERLTVIGPNSTLFSCDEIINCLLGPNTILKSSSVSNSTVLSSLKRPVSITSGARVSNCIINAACSLSMGCHADHVFMSECSSLGDFARVSHTIMGPDSSVAGGECHHCLLGPFVGFHHQSLLIAAIWPTGRGMSLLHTTVRMTYTLYLLRDASHHSCTSITFKFLAMCCCFCRECGVRCQGWRKSHWSHE